MNSKRVITFLFLVIFSISFAFASTNVSLLEGDSLLIPAGTVPTDSTWWVDRSWDFTWFHLSTLIKTDNSFQYPLDRSEERTAEILSNIINRQQKNIDVAFNSREYYVNQTYSMIEYINNASYKREVKELAAEQFAKQQRIIAKTIGDMSGTGSTQIIFNDAGVRTEVDTYIPPSRYRYFDFNLTPNVTGEEGRLHWNSEEGTLSIGMPGGEVELQIGQEQLIKVKADEDILNGQVVYIKGAVGTNRVAALARADAEEIAHKTVAVATENISSGQSGYVTTFGLVRELDTSAFVANQTVYLSDTAYGELTAIEPITPNFSVSIGLVTRSHATEGELLVLIHHDLWKTLVKHLFNDVYGMTPNNIPFADLNGNLTENNNFTFNGTDLQVPKYERHVQITVIAAGNVANLPTPEDIGTAGGYEFASSGTQEELHFQWEVPDDWDGEDIKIELDWLPNSGDMTSPDAVNWVFEYRSIAEGEVLTTGGVGRQSVIHNETTLQNTIIHSPVMIMVNDTNQPITKQDHIYGKFYRNTSVANDFAGTVIATAFEILYNSTTFPRSN